MTGRPAAGPLSPYAILRVAVRIVFVIPPFLPSTTAAESQSAAGVARGRIGWGLVGLRHRSGENVGLAVERGDQAVDAVGSQDRSEFGAAGRYLADCAVEVDVGDKPALAVAAHHIIDPDRLAIGLDDLA